MASTFPRREDPSLRTRPLWLALAGLVLLACAAWHPAAAQHPASPDRFVHEAWTTADGLPVNALTDLIQTRDGYLWLSSFDGLARFDGVRFQVFNRSNTPGLPENRILDLIETPDGTLWARTERWNLVALRGGRAAVVGATEGLHGVEVRWTHLAPDGTFYAATETGLFAWTGTRFEERWRYDPSTALVSYGFAAASSLSDSHGALWIGTVGNGLLRLRAGSATLWSHVDGLPLAHVVAMAEDERGRLWMQARPWDATLQRHSATGFFWHEDDRLHRAAFGAPCRLDAMPEGARLLHRDATHCLVAYAGLYFSGTTEPGQPGGEWSLLARPLRDGAGHRWFTDRSRLYRDDGLALALPAAVAAAAADHEGSLWVATNGGGLHRFNPSPAETYGARQGLPSENVYAILADRRGGLWTAWAHFGDGLYRFGPGPPVHYGEGFRSKRIAALYEDRSGTIWAGTFAGPCRLRDPGLPGAACVPLDLGEHSSEEVFSIYEDTRGDLWFGGNQKLLRYTRGGTWRAYTSGFGPEHRRLRAVAEDRAGTLWFGGALGGLTAFVPGAQGEGRFYRLTTADGLPSGVVRDLYVDEEGFVWVVTEDAGLARLDLREAATPADARIAIIQQRHGLPSDALHSLRGDAFGRFWISSNQGLFRVDRTALHAFADGEAPGFQVNVYTERHELRNREFNGGFFPASSQGPDGRLYFPSQAGVVVVDPARVPRNDIAPPVAIEALRSQNRPFVLDAPPVLAPDERSFEIDYTALSFLAPENVRFRYRLEGFDTDWVEAGGRRTAYYTGVPPGTYTFHVVASNNDGVWNETGARLVLTVRPYFYEAGWFYGLCGALLAASVFGTYRWRVRRLRLRQHLLEAEVEARTRQVVEEKRKTEQALAVVAEQAGQLRHLDAMKSHFFANISHEFRTPLTLILGPIDDALAGRQPPDRHMLALVRRNASRLLHLINQLLELARADAGSLVLRAHRHDLVAVVRRCAALFESLAHLRGLRLTIEAAVPVLPLGFDEEKVEKVVVNLLSNALNFTPAGGSIRVEVAPAPGGQARVSVVDTGVGIATEHLPRLFDRFYQVEPATTRRHEGSGIGLALVRELVTLHGGTVTVASEEGQGATFTVLLPDVVPTDEHGDGLPAAPYLPFYEEPPGARPATTPVEASPAGELPLVLVVEDNPDLRAYLALQLAGVAQVREAADGAAGLEQALALVPDLVLSDVMMPERDGYDLCRALKTDERTSHVPVVLLTARADAESRIAGLETGADDYLPKPFDAEELRARVRNLIAQRRRLRARFSQEVLVAGAAEVTLPTREVSFLEHVRQVILANVPDADFGVDALAEALSMSRRQLERKLQALVGEAPGALLRRVRMERAAELLRREGTTVKEIAGAVGYRSVPHFTEAFRDAYGTSPAAFAGLADAWSPAHTLAQNRKDSS